MEFLRPVMWHDHDIDFAQCGIWLWSCDSEFTKWQHPAMWYVALGWHAIEFAKTSAILECYIWFPFPHITTSPQSTCHSLPVCEILSKSDHPRQKKWSHVDFQDAGSISAILDCRDPIMGSLKSPCATSYRSSIETIPLNCLLFEKIAFLHFGDRQTKRQTDKRTNRWTSSMREAAVSLSQAAA